MKIKNLLIFGIVFILLAISVNANGLTYFDFANTTDQWDNATITFNDATLVLQYPTFLNSSNSSPDSYSFVGTQHIEYLNNIDFSQDYAISLWAYFTTDGNRVFFEVEDDVSNEKIQFRIDGGKIKFKHEGGTALEIESLLTNYDEVTGWNNFIVSVDRFNNVGQIYFNGEQITYSKQTIGIGLTDVSTTSPIYIGNALNLDRAINGYLDEYKVYQTEITPEDALSIYSYGDKENIIDDNDIIDETVLDFGSCPSDARDWKNSYIILGILFVLGIVGSFLKNVVLEVLSGIFLVIFSVVWFHCWTFFGYVILIFGIIFIFTGLSKEF